MADKKKMSVAEMLAAARNADGQGGAEQAADALAEASPTEATAAASGPTP